MDRKILFRGKRKNGGEWIEGGLSIFVLPNGKEIYAIVIHPNVILEVIPETVGEFTGWYDKNGTKIFEEDILDFTRKNALGYITQQRGVVSIFENIPAFHIMTSVGGFDLDECNTAEIIGNIHDNPELMEVQE